MKFDMWPQDSANSFKSTSGIALMTVISADLVVFGLVKLVVLATLDSSALIMTGIGLLLLLWKRHEIVELLGWIIEGLEELRETHAAMLLGGVERYHGRRALVILLILYSVFMTLTNYVMLETLNKLSKAVFILGLLPIGLAVLLMVGVARYVFASIVLNNKRNRRVIDDIQTYAIPGQILRIAHLSDLHIPANVRLTEAGEWDHDRLAHIVATLEENRPDTIVISGDVTDTGAPEAWEKFSQTFAKYKNEEKIVIAPGNHDLNIVGYGILSLIFVSDLPGRVGRTKRLRSYLDTANAMMGNRAFVYFENKVRRLDDIFKNECIDDFTYEQMAQLFPMIVRAGSQKMDSRHYYVVWNTVRSSSLAFNNSFGKISDDQLARFTWLLNGLPDAHDVALVHVMHHKLALPEKSLDPASSYQTLQSKVWHHYIKNPFQLAGMILVNAHVVIDQLEKNRKASLVLHGHHHAVFSGLIKGKEGEKTYVVSAPSTTLGTEFYVKNANNNPGFDIVRVLIDKNSAHLKDTTRVN